MGGERGQGSVAGGLQEVVMEFVWAVATSDGEATAWWKSQLCLS